MSNKKIFLIFIIFICNSLPTFSNEIKIISKVNNEIITNVDLENQKKYLLLMNDNLKNLSKSEILKLSKNSLIREIIKKNETKKYIKFEKNSELEEKLIHQNYSNLGFKSMSEYLSILKKKDLSLEFIKNKLLIEKLWNTLIFEKFKDKVNVDQNEIKKRIKLYQSKQDKLYEVNLSEILFNFQSNFVEIKKFIEQHGFESAATKYSISDTSSHNGKIGWVNLNNLAPQIQKKILVLEVGNYTNPIEIPNGRLILKLNSKKEIKRKFDFKREMKKQITFEQNRQLNNFSLNYYKKLKQNSIIINEY